MIYLLNMVISEFATLNNQRVFSYWRSALRQSNMAGFDTAILDECTYTLQIPVPSEECLGENPSAC